MVLPQSVSNIGCIVTSTLNAGSDFSYIGCIGLPSTEGKTASLPTQIPNPNVTNATKSFDIPDVNAEALVDEEPLDCEETLEESLEEVEEEFGTLGDGR